MSDIFTSSSSTCTQQESEWRQVPISYHFDTVGIGDVFIVPPPINTLYKEYYDDDTSASNKHDNKHNNNSNNAEQEVVLTWEIVGTLKSCPQDFIVREIGGIGPRRSKNNTSTRSNNITKEDNETYYQDTKPKVADLTDLITLPPLNPTVESESTTNVECDNNNNNDYDGDNNNNATTDLSPTYKKQNIDHQHDIEEKSIKYVNSSMDAIQYIIMECTSTSTNNNTSTQRMYLEKIQKLNEDALNDIIVLLSKQSNDDTSVVNNTYHDESVIIPPITDEIKVKIRTSSDEASSKMEMTSSSNRSTFHRSIRMEYPLLSSSTLSKDESKMVLEYDSNLIGQCVRIEKNKLFHCIIQYLSHPQTDLIQLYRFHSNGCNVVAFGSVQHERDRSNKKRSRQNNKRMRNDCEENNSNGTSCVNEVYLRLKPELSKDNRREVHHLIAKACRDFETGTVSNYEFEENGLIQKSSAITVFWSQKAKRKSLSKRNLQSKKTKSRVGDQNTLCILRKTNQEHLATITHLTKALKCRQSDISFAGIKDMCAVTYQFCTLKNISPYKARSANNVLNSNSIQIGNFDRVNWFLQPGMLDGNQFEIILRNIHRVEIQKDISFGLKERFVSCQSSHIDSMVTKIRDFGFVNFFGEQRVGDAGPSMEIGVRSFDIGRALLKRQYSEAIDLLMTGRNKSKGEYIEGLKLRNVRKVWKETDGDPIATLSAFPYGDAMIRERTVLQGLKRYGQNKPLDALRCLPYSIRMFWIHAYQSYVWNKMATERMKLGIKPLPGDLYMSTDSDDVKIVLKPQSILFSQIVLPLPGHSVQYPTNLIGDMYKQFLETEGVEFNKAAPADSSAKGGYRHLMIKPNYIEWQPINDKKVVDKEGNISDVLFKFSLPSGSYATMALRELLSSQVAR